MKPLLLSAALLAGPGADAALAQGVPTTDVKNLAQLVQMLTEAQTQAYMDRIG